MRHSIQISWAAGAVAVSAAFGLNLTGASFARSENAGPKDDTKDGLTLKLPVDHVEKLKKRIGDGIAAGTSPMRAEAIRSEQQEAFDRWVELSTNLRSFDTMIAQVVGKSSEFAAGQIVDQGLTGVLANLTLTDQQAELWAKEVRQPLADLVTCWRDADSDHKAEASKALLQFDFRELQRKVHVTASRCRGEAPRIAPHVVREYTEQLEKNLTQVEVTLPSKPKDSKETASLSPDKAEDPKQDVQENATIAFGRELNAVAATDYIEMLYPALLEGRRRSAFETQSASAWRESLKVIRDLNKRTLQMVSELQ